MLPYKTLPHEYYVLANSTLPINRKSTKNFLVSFIPKQRALNRIHIQIRSQKQHKMVQIESEIKKN